MEARRPEGRGGGRGNGWVGEEGRVLLGRKKVVGGGARLRGVAQGDLIERRRRRRRRKRRRKKEKKEGASLVAISQGQGGYTHTHTPYTLSV